MNETDESRNTAAWVGAVTGLLALAVAAVAFVQSLELGEEQPATATDVRSLTAELDRLTAELSDARNAVADNSTEVGNVRGSVNELVGGQEAFERRLGRRSNELEALERDVVDLADKILPIERFARREDETQSDPGPGSEDRGD